MKTINCSSCGKQVNPEKCRANLALRKIVDNMPQKCKYDECEVILPGEKIRAHEKECEFKPCVCPNSDLCGIMMSKELNNHLQNQCEFRNVECSFRCGAVIVAKDFESHISRDCPEVTVQCVNMCNTQLKRGELSKHLESECPFQPTICEFAEHGCSRVVLRMQYADHIEADLKNHFLLLSKAVKNQTTEIKDLKQKVDQLSVARPLIDMELLNTGINHAKEITSCATNAAGLVLESARIKGCQIFSNRAGIASKIKSLIETSRIAQFALFYLLFTILSHVRMIPLFFLFVITTAITFTGMCTARQMTFTSRVIKIVAWASIFAIIFHSPVPFSFHQHRHHGGRFYR